MKYNDICPFCLSICDDQHSEHTYCLNCRATDSQISTLNDALLAARELHLQMSLQWGTMELSEQNVRRWPWLAEKAGGEDGCN